MTANADPAKPAVQFVDIAAGDAEVRLDRWLRRRLPDVPYGQLAKWLRTGQIRVDGRRAKPGQRLEPGQTVRLPPVAPREPTALPPSAPVDRAAAAELQNRVLFHDDWLLALNKPSGLAVQGGSKTTRHLDAMLEALRFDAAEAPRLVHRLDKDTSGVLLLARDAATARLITAQFRRREIAKVYWALVAGVPNEAAGRIDLALRKTPGRGGEKVRVAADGGQSAETRYSVIDTAGRRVAWLELIPQTGRTHQLRVHCAALGTPIVGDGKYGGKAAFVVGLANKLHLHARALRFVHPHTRAPLEIVAPLDGHCAAGWAKLGFDADSGAAAR